MAHKHAQSGRGAWRVIVVCVLTFLVGALTLPDIVLPWHPFASFGFDADPTGRIVYVRPTSAAADAGVREGDAIDMAASDLAVRRILIVPYSAAPPGEVVTFPVINARGERHDVTLTARVRVRSTIDNVADIAQNLGYVIFLVAGSALVLLRPSGLTWAFYWYALSACGGAILLESQAPIAIALVTLGLSGIESLAWLPMIVFALRFPADRVAGWRLVVERTLLGSLLVLVPLALYAELGPLLPVPYVLFVSPLIGQILPLAGFLFAAAVFVITYANAPASDHPRLRWVITGFLIGYGGLVIQGVIATTSLTAWPIWVNDFVQTLNVAVPLSVAYAIFKHRVIDVRFYLNRALVYGLLTTTLILVVALLHWVVSKQLEEFHFGIVVEIAGVLAIGISLQKLHGVLDRLVDRFVFRSVHEAEEHLRKTAASMMYAQSIGSLDRMVCTEPMRALRLAWSSVHRASEETGAFPLRETAGDHTSGEDFERDDPLVLELYATKKLVGCPDFTAFPFVIRDEVAGFALFGAHANGSGIDPNELEILEDFIHHATIAYDHYTSRTRAVEIARLRTENETLKSLVTIRRNRKEA